MADSRIALQLLLVLVAAPDLRAQEIELGTPAPVVRRIAQAVWPENLFDSLGHPEPGFVHVPSRPKYSDLRITKRTEVPDRFAGVILYAGSAYPSDCFHCRGVRRAVAQRASEYVTLLEPEEIEQLLPWAAPALAITDSVELREAIVGLLELSCLLGCEIQHVRERAEVPRADFWSAADPNAEGWAMPRTYSHVSSTGLTLDFPVLARDGLFQIKAALDRRGNYYVMVIPVAQPMLGG